MHVWFWYIDLKLTSLERIVFFACQFTIQRLWACHVKNWVSLISSKSESQSYFWRICSWEVLSQRLLSHIQKLFTLSITLLKIFSSFFELIAFQFNVYLCVKRNSSCQNEFIVKATQICHLQDYDVILTMFAF